eukprot:COSAG02_NODE_3995_length_5939_cov_3.184621_1_plen_485_part_00
MLFLDGGRLASWSGVELRLGQSHLLSAYRDPTSFVGWGYPSTWKKADGSGWRTMYQGWHLADSKEDTKLALLADSPDAISWTPASVKNPVYNVSNCVLKNGGAEFSVVYDDATYTAKPQDRLKCLWGGDTITASGDEGETWHSFGKWTSEPIDPGVSVYRDPWKPDELVVTARPQGLRRTDGRHAGYHSGIGWDGLANSVNTRALPLDNVFTRTNEPYGLPSFSYHGNVISWFWRYSCQQYPCYKGGFVSSALAFSYNSQNWSAFGQYPFPTSSPSAEVVARETAYDGPAVGRGPLNNTDIASVAYGHTYKVFANKRTGALSCQAECDADPNCKAWTYVVGGKCCGQERCCRHRALGCPKTGSGATGCISGAKTPGHCSGKSIPPPPSPPDPPAQRLPELFPNEPGTLSAGQIYPNTLIELPNEGRVLVHSSASTNQHGFVSSEPKSWSSILTHEIRLDGFTCISASESFCQSHKLANMRVALF